MTVSPRAPARRWVIPQVLQASSADAGLAALQGLLQGFRAPVSLEPLRQLAARHGDPAAFDTLERTAADAGLTVRRRFVSPDHLLLAPAQALPALVRTRTNDGTVQYLVLWNRLASWVQVLDPRTGRRWMSPRELLDVLPVQSRTIAAAEWRAAAGTPQFTAPLRARMSALWLKNADADAWLQRALHDPEWRGLAQLDAAVRMVTALVQAGALRRGPEAARVMERILTPPPPGSGTGTAAAPLVVPPQYWSVQNSASRPSGSEILVERGIPILHVAELVRAPRTETARETRARPAGADVSAHSLRQVLELVRADGLLTPALLAVALVAATLAVMVQALVFQGLIDLTGLLRDRGQQLLFVAAIVVFMAVLFAVEVPINAIVLRMGRKLEMRFRIRFLDKIPRLGDYFFQGHLKSDLVQRAHSLRQLHLLPELAVTLFRLSFQLVLTTLGIIWLDPPSALLALSATASFLGLAYVTQPILQERDLRLRAQTGALSRFYLDAMLGLVPLKMHGAQRFYRREYEARVHDWSQSNWDLVRASNFLQALGVFVYALFAVLLVFDFIARSGTATGTLLLFFWILSLPVLATSFVQAVQQYPMLRSLTLRVLEPLNAPDENQFPVGRSNVQPATFNLQPATPLKGVSIEFSAVTVQLGGNTVLRDVQFAVRPGEHVAIVGPSGAGKTTLVGLLLGWHEPTAGECRVDGEIVRGAHLQALRRATVWVDPAIQLWNRTLWENVLYGNAPHALASPSRAVQEADLLDVIEQLDQGVETVLGESGGLVSGGEGQRVRLARGMARAGTRLVILDEPFRGLDRETRRTLLARAREFWRGTTLLCVTHDVNETRAFERVIVVEQGRIVEDAPPSELAANPASRYRALLDGEDAVRSGLWQSAEWRRLWIQDGMLRERAGEPHAGGRAEYASA